MDESKPISATDIVNDPTQIRGLLNEYIMLKDTSMLGTYKNLIESANIMSEYGWEVISMSSDSGGNMYMLMRNRRFKRKNE